MHTLEGKRAFAYFRKACEPVNKWLTKHFPTEELWKKHTMEFIGLAEFLLESGCVLRRKLYYGEQEAILHDVLDQEAVGFGLEYHTMMEGYELIFAHLEELNYARRRVIEGK